MLDWQDGQPVSRRYGDVYFSRAGGLDETRHVFLDGNRLPQRFAALAPGPAFVIGETGFGTGLNFLCAWELFDQTAPRGAQLHFVSTEIEPLSAADLDAALSLWPRLARYRVQLLAQYRSPSGGWHRFSFAQGRVRLTLLVGDARRTLAALQGDADAWFLDGFAPAKNPELWEEGLLRAIAAHSRAGATAASYSCAGSVRRGLAAAGFRVWKAAGFGSKREMLCAQTDAGSRARLPSGTRHAIVIGAGLAGCAAADSLAQRGWRVTLIERSGEVASVASGNPQGILYARLSAHGTPLSRLVLAGYQHTLRMLRARLPCDGEAWSDCPVLQLAFDMDEAARQRAVLNLGWPEELLRGVDAAQASEAAGMPLDRGALLFPGGGWVHPPALCRALVSHPLVEVRTDCAAAALHFRGDHWEVADGQRSLAQAAVAIVAAGVATAELAHLRGLPLRVNRGQLTLLQQTPASAQLRAVLCGERYAAPARRGVHCVGATFAREADDEVRPADHAENLAMLARLSPSLLAALGAPDIDAVGLGGRAALRCTSPDYLPLVGPAGPAGLHVSAAHGSRGLVTAPLAGEVLAAWLDDEPAPLPADMMRALQPLRFGDGGKGVG